MTTLIDLVKSVITQIQAGDLESLKIGLNTLNSVPQQQFNVYQRQVSKYIEQLTSVIERNIRNNIRLIKSSQDIVRPIRSLLLKLPPFIRKQITPVMRQIAIDAVQGQIQNSIEAQIDQQTKAIQKLVQTGVVASESPINYRNIAVQGQVALTPIQQSVQQYQPLFSYRVNTTKPDQLPQTMKLLSQYAAIKGFNPVGTISNLRGSSYVGTRQIDRGNGMIQTVPFEKNPIPKSTIPSIPLQLQYHANNAINSWNNYVKDQAKFVQYFTKVNDSTGRLNYVEEQFQNLNMYTFAAQAVASFMFYYYYLPLNKFHSNLYKNPGFPNTYDNFFKTYQFGDSMRCNPLILTNAQASQVVKQIIDTTTKSVSNINLPTPLQLYQKITTAAEKYKNSLNTKQRIKLLSYMEIKTGQAKQFLSQCGLDDVTIADVFAAKKWNSVIFKKINLPSIQNRQMNQIAMKVIGKSKNQQYQPMTYFWGASKIPCHDYLWDWQAF